ncbi:phage N-6-adenine-methyltransferase [Stenotrophomonas sp. GD03819]|uniref:DNA N-6-adenine-methyltransferase n=1 Tax=Stenotrophomonas sp. GD03819 TaxID=2975384 RepID=UPI00244D6E8D|nr:DNA N-6-adenine-methyltransferase [Stenotrophomonas sp. GD03819]MDH1791514.1 phage N-6-adenine-methyltransferase [Stenotrophomonas sp. GD03819]
MDITITKQRSSMGVGYEVSANTTTTWLTPRNIIEQLGPFDLDPCTPEQGMPWATATVMLKPSDDGLTTAWPQQSFVWMNPPYGRGQDLWMKKMAEHGNGLALVLARMEVQWMHEFILEHPSVHSILLPKGRLRYCKPDGVQGDPATAGSLLIAYGERADKQLRKIHGSTVHGKLIDLKR